MFKPREKILGQGSMNMAGKVLFVARGTLVEKDGQYDDTIFELKHKAGNVACLQNLLPNSESSPQISDVYCHGSTVATVTPLDLNHLKHILNRDKGKLTKLWEVLSFRMIIISLHKNDYLKQFHLLSQDKIKMFCKLCNIGIYKSTDVFDLQSGGVLLRGSCTELS
jgi:hypothetical protein